MSAENRQIECRSCDEVFDVDRGNCPRCGTGVRSKKGPAAMIAVGALIVLFGVGTGGWLHALVGFLVGLGGAYLLYDQRQRVGAGRDMGRR